MHHTKKNVEDLQFIEKISTRIISAEKHDLQGKLESTGFVYIVEQSIVWL